MLPRKELPTYEKLAKLLSYDPLTGKFTWNAGTFYAGREAGYVKKEGYRYIRFGSAHCGKDRKYMAHRLAWILYYKTSPDGYIDHINGDRSDNRIANLRMASNRENQQNREEHREGKLPGVHKTKLGTYVARFRVNGKRIETKSFKTPEEAYSAYKELCEQYDPCRYLAEIG